jgi:hypothetical protein
MSLLACCCLLQLRKKIVENDNEPRGSLSFSTIKDKKIDDDDKLGSQFIVVIYSWRVKPRDND